MSKFKQIILCANCLAMAFLTGCVGASTSTVENAHNLVAKPARDISYLSSVLLPADELEEPEYQSASLPSFSRLATSLTPYSRAQNSSETSTAWFTTIEGYQTEHVNPKNLISITSPFGKRGRKAHNGIDIRAPKNTEILALLGGTVVYASRNGAYGLMVDIEHKDGTKARYAHMEKILVEKGDVVLPGMNIGLVGRTGRATGNHLHIEFYENNKVINPAKYMTSTEQVLRLADSDTQVANK